MAYDTLIDKAKEEAERRSLADVIRAKGRTAGKLTWGKGFEDAVKAIDTALPTQEKTAHATVNGPVVLTPDPGKTLSKATVTVEVTGNQKPEQTKTVSVKHPNTVTVIPDSGKTLSQVTVLVEIPEWKGGSY